MLPLTRSDPGSPRPRRCSLVPHSVRIPIPACVPTVPGSVSAPPRRIASSGVLAAGVALLVATLGFQLVDSSDGGVRSEFGYGSTLGFVGAGLLIVLAAARSRPPALDWSRVPVRLAPIAACAAYLTLVV